MLDYPVEVLEMLPDEVANAAVFWDCFEGAVRGLVSRCGTSDGDVVDVPRMRQRSAKIGDLSVNPMWF